MGRPRKQIPDLYWLASEKKWCINLRGVRERLSADKLEAEGMRLRLVNAALAAEAPSNEQIAGRVAAASPADASAGAGATVAVVLLAYRRGLRPNIDPRYVARVDQVIALILGDFADLPANHFSSIQLRAIRDKLVRADYARATINAMMGVAKTAWGWCVESVLVTGDRAASVLRLRALREGDGGTEPEPRIPVDDERVEKTLPKLHAMMRDAVRLIRLTGMRPIELCRMRRCDVSTTAAEVIQPLPGWRVTAATVPVAGATEGTPPVVVWLYAPPAHKTRRKGKVRVIAFGPAAQEILARWLGGMDPASTDCVFSPQRAEEARSAERRAARVVPIREDQEQARAASKASRRRGRAPGPRYSTEALDKAVLRACEAAGVEPWTLYQLRHGLGTSVAELHGEDVAAEVLGHAAGSAATATYTRTRLARLVELAARG